jgi:hypothetical protein
MGGIGLWSYNQPTSSLAYEARAINFSFIIDLTIIDSFYIQSECIPSDK